MNAGTLNENAVGRQAPGDGAVRQGRPGAARRRPAPAMSWTARAVGVILVLAVWEVIAETVLRGRHVLPAPGAVVARAAGDGFYGPSLAATLWQAGRGWLSGTALAAVLGAVSILAPRLEPVIARLGVVSYCVPTVAAGPVLIVLFAPDTTKVIMAALSVFFVTLTGVTAGLRAAPKQVLDYVASCGGHSGQALVKVRLRAAVPAAVAGLALGAPAAVLGAILGDFMGGTQGLGVVMMQAQSSFQVSRVWAVGLVATVVSGLAFAVITGIGRILSADSLSFADAPGWEAGSAAPGARQQPGGRWPGGAARNIAAIAGTAAGALAVWWAAVAALNLNPYFAKTPLDVWRALGHDAGAGSQWPALGAGLAVTLEHAALGFAVGAGLALAVAAATLITVVDAAVMPVVVVLRAVPLVAMTPVLGLLFGDGTVAIAAAGAIVTFVPSVVMIASGLRATPRPSLDLFRAYGASRIDTVAKLRLRYALPALCDSVKVAVPGAVLGSVLAEWLLGSSGVGHLMAVSIIGSNFSLLWACAAAVTIVSLVLYQLISDAERIVVRWAVQ